MKNIQRLDKILSNMGLGTRKEVKQLVKDGAVEIDGVAAKDSSMQIDINGQKIYVFGKELVYREFIYIMLNKPQGIISATEDTREKTVVDLLSKELKSYGLAPVGRLDKDTEGLMVLTNDGQLSHQLLSPKNHIPKTYYAKINGVVTEDDVERFARGVILEDGYKTLPSKLKILESGDISAVEIIIYEGKFHQIKRMFVSVGKQVIYLKRIAMNKLELDENLQLGEYRELYDSEVELLKNS